MQNLLRIHSESINLTDGKYPDEDALANAMSLNEAREAYKKGEKIR